MKSRCVIFDLDGTLVDSEALGNQALLDLLPEIDESVDTLTERYQGKKLAEIFADIEERFQISIPEGFEAIYREHAAKLFERELKPVPGVIEMLNQISNSRCIASSGPLAKIKLSLKITGLAEYFGSNLFSAYEINTWKPEPELFLHAAREMGFKPEQCVVVEDSLTGVEAARSAEMVVLHFSSQPISPNGKAYRSFDDMADLPFLLREYDHVD